jgi:hypothetical protein
VRGVFWPVSTPVTDFVGLGDLDGDLYSVIWDERLIPESEHPPLDYAQLLEDATKENPNKGTVPTSPPPSPFLSSESTDSSHVAPSVLRPSSTWPV